MNVIIAVIIAVIILGVVAALFMTRQAKGKSSAGGTRTERAQWLRHPIKRSRAWLASWRRSRRERRQRTPRGVRWASVLLLLVLAAWVAVAFDWWERPTAPGNELPGALVISFGLNRSELTRERVIDMCAFKSEGEQEPECKDNPPKTTEERPAVLSTTLVGDMTPGVCAMLKGSEEPGLDNGAQFPARQVQATSELVGLRGLRFVVTANPSEPQTVPAGRYCGQIVVERTGQPRAWAWDVVARVDDRGNVQPVTEAVLWLLLGALAGVAIRMANDPLSALVPLRRRQRALMRWAQSEQLPPDDPFMLGLESVADAIAMLDAPAAASLLDNLEDASRKKDEAARQQALTSFVSTPLTRGRGAGASTERTAAWVLDRYWVGMILLLVVVVVGAGLSTQYFTTLDFDDEFQDWFGLTLFALAFQVTASTVAEAAGKLSPSATQTSAGQPRSQA